LLAGGPEVPVGLGAGVAVALGLGVAVAAGVPLGLGLGVAWEVCPGTVFPVPLHAASAIASPRPANSARPRVQDEKLICFGIRFRARLTALPPNKNSKTASNDLESLEVISLWRSPHRGNP
jgi:hypothetical protein